MKTKEILKKYSRFRKNMGVPIDKRSVLRFWDKEKIESIERKDIKIDYINNPSAGKKIEIAKENIKYLKLFNWVKFIAVSGSVASGFAKEEDDIDIFVIVKNDRIWIYRGIVLFRNIFHKKIRVGDSDINVKDKLCLNFITEERFQNVEPDIFNLNEILSLIPIYNEDYLKIFIHQNNWLFSEFNVSKDVTKGLNKSDLRDLYRRNIFLSAVNFLFFLPQIVYMKLLKHDPDYKRILDNYKNGRIEFFRKDFKEEKLKDLK
jgi:hypothetical protein